MKTLMISFKSSLVQISSFFPGSGRRAIRARLAYSLFVRQDIALRTRGETGNADAVISRTQMEQRNAGALQNGCRPVFNFADLLLLSAAVALHIGGRTTVKLKKRHSAKVRALPPE